MTLFLFLAPIGCRLAMILFPYLDREAMTGPLARQVKCMLKRFKVEPHADIHVPSNGGNAELRMRNNYYAGSKLTNVVQTLVVGWYGPLDMRPSYLRD
jgi:hypothetical protein